MSILGKLAIVAVKTVTLPVQIVKDGWPGGGGYVDGNASLTGETVEEIKDKLERIAAELEK